MRINTKNGLPSQAVLSAFFIESDYPPDCVFGPF